MGGSARAYRLRTWIQMAGRDCSRDALNRSRIATVVCVPLTTNLRWADAPGNLALSSRLTGLPQESVANVSQILTLDRDLLGECVGKLPRVTLELLLSGIDVILGR